MHYTIEKLLQNDINVMAWYHNARRIWKEIFNQIDPGDGAKTNLLAEELTYRQIQFERECGGRWIGQEIMVVSGIGQFYSTKTGFDSEYGKKNERKLKKAMNLFVAFQLSHCSIEVKGHARDVATSYGLEADWR